MSRRFTEREGSDARCNCMVLFDPVLPPGEHAHDCPLRRGTLQYRATSDERPQSWWDAWENDGLWDDDREEAEEMAEVLRGLGSRNVRVVHRIHLPVGRRLQAETNATAESLTAKPSHNPKATR